MTAMNRRCRKCGGHATHIAVCLIPRQIIDGRGRLWDMHDEIHKWYCDRCAPNNAVPATHIGTATHKRDNLKGEARAAQTAGPRDQEAQQEAPR